MSPTRTISPEDFDALRVAGPVPLKVRSERTGGWLSCRAMERDGDKLVVRLPGRAQFLTPISEARVVWGFLKKDHRDIWQRLLFGNLPEALPESPEPVKVAATTTATPGSTTLVLTPVPVGNGLATVEVKSKPGTVRTVSVTPEPRPDIAALIAAVESASHEEVAAHSLAADATRARLMAEHALRMALVRQRSEVDAVAPSHGGQRCDACRP